MSQCHCARNGPPYAELCGFGMRRWPIGGIRQIRCCAAHQRKTESSKDEEKAVSLSESEHVSLMF